MIGLIAFWKSIQAVGTIIYGIGMFSPLFENNEQIETSFIITFGLAIILNFILPLAVAIIFLFKTEKVLSLIKTKKESQIDLPIDKPTFYYIIVITFGFMIITHGTGNFLHVNYKTNTITEHTKISSATSNQTPNIINEKKVSVTNSKSKNVNYFALIEILFGIILISKASDISRQIEKRLDSKMNKLTRK